ncbi:hypothetical protein EYC84_010370 [Monilinia fructicola]|uniref:Uncharacterized protein n=1 Tax=Monilinia fructicola TaxID=38448 RepID=A0A5M9JFC2_MONFR|nr:hypothetical protein EYC84_010370 [Monilinia fructicola]
MFPGPAKDVAEFEKQDDEWWRFEIAGATVEELRAKLADHDPEVARAAQETLLRIGGADGSGDEYWPEGARNPFAGAERFQQPVVEDISPGAPNSPNHRFPAGYRFTEGYQGPGNLEEQAPSGGAGVRTSPARVVEGSPVARQRFRRLNDEPSPPGMDEAELERIRNAIALEGRGGGVVDDSKSSFTMGDDHATIKSGGSSPFLDSPLS